MNRNDDSVFDLPRAEMPDLESSTLEGLKGDDQENSEAEDFARALGEAMESGSCGGCGNHFNGLANSPGDDGATNDESITLDETSLRVEYPAEPVAPTAPVEALPHTKYEGIPKHIKVVRREEEVDPLLRNAEAAIPENPESSENADASDAANDDGTDAFASFQNVSDVGISLEGDDLERDTSVDEDEFDEDEQFAIYDVDDVEEFMPADELVTLPEDIERPLEAYYKEEEVTESLSAKFMAVATPAAIALAKGTLRRAVIVMDEGAKWIGHRLSNVVDATGTLIYNSIEDTRQSVGNLAYSLAPTTPIKMANFLIVAFVGVSVAQGTKPVFEKIRDGEFSIRDNDDLFYKIPTQWFKDVTYNTVENAGIIWSKVGPAWEASHPKEDEVVPVQPASWLDKRDTEETVTPKLVPVPPAEDPAPRF